MKTELACVSPHRKSVYQDPVVAQRVMRRVKAMTWAQVRAQRTDPAKLSISTMWDRCAHKRNS